jgi:hypothetical protein
MEGCAIQAIRTPLQATATTLSLATGKLAGDSTAAVCVCSERAPGIVIEKYQCWKEFAEAGNGQDLKPFASPMALPMPNSPSVGSPAAEDSRLVIWLSLLAMTLIVAGICLAVIG